jgi:hypothetical protein
MRFSEFKRLQENTPAVIQKDLKTLSPNLIQMTKDLSGKIGNKIAAAVGQAPLDPKASKIQMPPGMQSQMQVQPTAIQQAQKQAAQQQTKPKIMPIPAVGSQIVLPDLDTKKPGSFTIKKAGGQEVTLEPVKQTPNAPRVNVMVPKKDLQNTLSTLDPNNKVGTK